MDTRKLRIVVIGYYGKQNAGDDLLQASICQLFQEHDLMFTAWFPGIDLLNAADLIVVGGGSIWPGNPFFENAKALAKSLKTPFLVLGISAKHVDAKLCDDTKYLIDKASLFHVRDRATFNMFDHEGVTLGTDLYWTSEHFLPPISPTSSQGIALNLRPWSGNWNPQHIKAALETLTPDLLPFPFYFGSSTHEVGVSSQDVELLSELGIKSVPSSFDTTCLSRSQLAVAMRYHGVLVSVRAGLPVVGFDYHEKTRNFFTENHIGEYCVPLGNVSRLQEIVEHIQTNRADAMKQFDTVRARQLQQGQIDKQKILHVIKSISPSGPNLSQRLKTYVKRLV